MKLERLNHLWIRLRVRRWIGPALCALPYGLSIFWLLARGQGWMAALMLSPVLLMGSLGLLTWWLARLEFQGRRRRGC